MKAQIHLQMFQMAYHVKKAALKYVEMYNRVRKKHLEAALRKAAEWKRKNDSYHSRRILVREKDTLIQMIEDRKSRESRRGATETWKL